MRQRMCHRPPRLVFKKIQDDINPIRAGHIKPSRHALFGRSNRAVLLVAFERDDGDRHRHLQLLFQQQLPENGPHLFHPQSNFSPAFFAGIGDHRKMRGMQLHPLGLVFVLGGCQLRETARKEQTQQNGRNTKAALHGRILLRNASTPANQCVPATSSKGAARKSRLSPWPNPASHVTLSTVTTAPSSRLAWIDWMRGLACVLMFQTHCYDAWLGGAARNTGFLTTSQLLGTLPAPLFLFLAGVSFALVTDKLIRKNLSPSEITHAMARHGAEIFAFGLLFRLQEYVIAWGWAPWPDLLRVDILNIIGLSMMLMALLCGLTLLVQVWRRAPSRACPERSRRVQAEPTGVAVKPGVGLTGWRSSAAASGHHNSRTPIIVAALAATATIALLTPPLYTTWRPTWLPW